MGRAGAARREGDRIPVSPNEHSGADLPLRQPNPIHRRGGVEIRRRGWIRTGGASTRSTGRDGGDFRLPAAYGKRRPLSMASSVTPAPSAAHATHAASPAGLVLSVRTLAYTARNQCERPTAQSRLFGRFGQSASGATFAHIPLAWRVAGNDAKWSWCRWVAVNGLVSRFWSFLRTRLFDESHTANPRITSPHLSTRIGGSDIPGVVGARAPSHETSVRVP